MSALSHEHEQIRVTEIRIGDFADLPTDQGRTVYAEILSNKEVGGGMRRLTYHENRTGPGAGSSPIESLLCDDQSEFPVWR